MAREKKDEVEVTFRANGALHEGHFELGGPFHTGQSFDIAPLIKLWPDGVRENTARMWRSLSTAPDIHAAVVLGQSADEVASFLGSVAHLGSDAVVGVKLNPVTGRYVPPPQELLRRWTNRKIAVVMTVFEHPVAVTAFVHEAIGALAIKGAGAVVNPYGFGSPEIGKAVPFSAGLASPRGKWPVWPVMGCPLCVDGVPSMKIGGEPPAR